MGLVGNIIHESIFLGPFGPPLSLQRYLSFPFPLSFRKPSVIMSTMSARLAACAKPWDLDTMTPLPPPPVTYNPETFRHYSRHVVASTWAKHKRVIDELILWLNCTGRSSFGPDDLLPFLDHLIEGHDAENWTKAKVRAYKVGIEHWLACYNRGAYPYWEGKTWNRTWDSVWYQAKEGSCLPSHWDRETMRGAIGHDELVQLINFIWKYPQVCGRRNPKDVVEALIVLHGCCLRVTEFARMEIGDFCEITNRLYLRCNKGTTINNGNRTNIYYQLIKVIHPEAIAILKNRQRRLRSEKPLQKLIFAWADIPVAELRSIIKTAAHHLGWSPLLQWCPHGLRHGGAQVAVKIFQNSQSTANPVSRAEFISAVHMSRSTYESTYGVSMDQREETAYQRSTRGKRNR